MKNLKNTPKNNRHGGRREGAGRKKGVPNKMTAELKQRAMVHALRAVDRIGELSITAKSEMAQIVAGNSLINRGFGRPGLAAPDGGDVPVVRIERVYRWARNEAEATPDPARPRTVSEATRVGAKETRKR